MIFRLFVHQTNFYVRFEDSCPDIRARSTWRMRMRSGKALLPPVTHIVNHERFAGADTRRTGFSNWYKLASFAFHCFTAVTTKYSTAISAVVCKFKLSKHLSLTESILLVFYVTQIQQVCNTVLR